MESLDKISIVLATYNGEKYLAEQLDSILTNVGFHELIGEIVVTDDGSSDNTEVIIKEYIKKHPFISFYKNPSKGVVDNFKNGLMISKFDYVMFCDQDDIWLGEKISLSFSKIREMEAEKGRDIPALAFTDSKVVDANLNVIHESFFKYIGADIKKGLTLNKLMVNNVAQGCVMIINRALIDKLDYNTSQSWVMHDWWIMLIAAMYNNIQVIPEPMLLYRQHNANVFGAKKNSPLNKFLRVGKTFKIYKTSSERIMIQNKAFIRSYPDLATRIDRFSLLWYVKNESSLKRRLFALLCIKK